MIWAGRRIYAWLVLLLLILGGWVGLADPLASAGRLSWLVYDTAVQRLRPPVSTDPRIVIVDLDDASLQARGRWPWPRQQLASLIDAIQRAEPAYIGLDILLPEPGTPQGDTQLAKRLAADNLSVATALGGIHLPEDGAGWPKARRELPPAETLSAFGTLALGHITPQLDADGHIRWLYPRLCGPNGCRDMLALAMLEGFIGLDVEHKRRAEGGRLCIGSFCQWYDAQGRLLVPYHHPSRFRYLSADAVMQGKHQDALSGAMVLVGSSAAGLGDLIATPRSALMPGVELHAIMLAAWLDSQAWRLLPHARLWQWAGLLGLVLIAGIGLATHHSWFVLRAGFVVLPAVVLATLPWILMRQGYWIDPWPWWVAICSILASWLWLEYKRLWQRHRLLYRAFGSYVPRSVLRQLSQTGNDTSVFEPQRRPLVIMFTDIRGFTTLSETLSPERLTELTNYIFTELTDVVHQHGGTLDKYIGDALMAFWGAPLAYSNDPERALECALAIQRRLHEVNAWCRRHDFPPITMNIGLEAGEVTVGNLGSRQRRAYTAMGQAVNLASRLEEFAASCRQPIVIGPGLAQRLPPYRLVPFMKVELKGLKKPVAVSLPRDSQTEPDSEVISLSDT